MIQPDACPPGQQRYKDFCVSTCPVGTFNNVGFCTRLCLASQYFWNSGCYETCPTNLNTADACVVACPAGTRKDPNSNTCVSGSTQSCGSGQYFNSAAGVCDNCRSPCATCSGSASFCTTCTGNLILRDGICYNGNNCAAGTYPTNNGCQKCSAKCATCTGPNTCSSCAPGYTNTGADCVQSTIPLAPVTINTMAVVKNAAANIVYIQLEVLPFLNNAPSSIYAQFVLVVQQQLAANRVNVWAQDSYVYVALTYNNGIPTTTISLILNSNVLDDLYRSMGYTTSNAFVQVSISNGIPTAPININIPTLAINSRIDIDVAKVG